MLATYRFLQNRDGVPSYERWQESELQKQEALVKMEQEPESRDQVFEKMTERAGSPYIARAYYETVRKQRERAARDQVAEREQVRDLTR